MPKGRQGQKRPADVNKRAVMSAKIAKVPTPEDEGKNPAAVALGRMGGQARASNLTKKRRSEIARKAAEKRWQD
jgi:hypothetical protein